MAKMQKDIKKHGENVNYLAIGIKHLSKIKLPGKSKTSWGK
nr:hypothetical protein [Mycoplasmopsis bovis]